MPSIKRLATICCTCQFVAMSAIGLADPPPEGEQASYVAQPTPGAALGARNRESRAPRQLPPDKAKSLPLPPRGAARASDTGETEPARPVKLTSSFLTGLAALAVVLGLFFVTAWALRRGMPAAPGRLPSEVVEVLGRTPLATRQFAHLIRCGNKLLLVHLAPGTAETLTEITDPAEVDRIAGLCRQSHPQSTTATFRQIFQQFAREKPDA
jgi:flagellar biogenesis protein FliO